MEFLKLNYKQYRSMVNVEKPSKGNKYHAVKVEDDGQVFDSKLEQRKWTELKNLERIGIISGLERQVRFILQEGYVNNQGKKIRPISYIADFVYYDKKRKQKIVMDTKSPATRTQVYLIKKKIFEKIYPEIIFVEAK